MTVGPGAPLPLAFYDRDVVSVARELIGCLLRHHTEDGEILAGRIVETEAYRYDDAASHAYRGPTQRNAAMFGPAGHAYVYVIYGMYDCFNVVCGPPGVANAVLIRAAEPTDGIPAMFMNRFGSPDKTGLGQLRNLASGPGKLCRAFRISRASVDGLSLESGPVIIHPRQTPVGEIVATRRLGISKATELEWRFVESGSEFVSRPAPGR
jgi:DNA-3-methyladenine glycosylase